MRNGGGFGRLGLGALVALLALVGAEAARASTLDVNSYVLGELVQVRSAVLSGPVYATEFQVELDGEAGFSYCVDLAQSLGVGTTTGWDVLSPEANAGVIRAAWLVDRFHGELDSFIGPANEERSFAITRRTVVTALQIAIWETLTDGAAGTDLHGGGFAIVEGGASTGALVLARSFLGELAGADLSFYVTDADWAVNARRQDQLVFTNPIPEPSSVVLLLVGGGVVALAARRKRA